MVHSFRTPGSRKGGTVAPAVISNFTPALLFAHPRGPGDRVEENGRRVFRALSRFGVNRMRTAFPGDSVRPSITKSKRPRSCVRARNRRVVLSSSSSSHRLSRSAAAPFPGLRAKRKSSAAIAGAHDCRGFRRHRSRPRPSHSWTNIFASYIRLADCCRKFSRPPARAP